MYIFTVLLIVFIVVTIYGLIEFALHQRRVYSIPIRIHINGTRGKSSVTRLIGAALREGGIQTITKVTGTYPRLILENGCEVAIYRKSGANIIEQLSIIKFASNRKAQAIVLECMAVQPQYQWITETKMLHSTIAVMTNVRLDHIDVMGYTLPEIAEALGNTIPRKQNLFTAEKFLFSNLKKIADNRNTTIHLAEDESVNDEDMSGFTYIEHKENVTLALAVSNHLGIDRKIALAGMYKAIPDGGALKLSRVNVFQKKINFFNAFAANDPQSTLMIWNKIKQEIGLRGVKIILLNTRQDRLDRAKQLAGMVGSEMNHEYDYLILIGQSSEVVEELAVASGVKRNKIVNLGWTEPDAVFEAVLAYTTDQSTVVAIGNMGGMGGQVADFLKTGKWFMVELAITLGLIFSLLSYEVFGLAAGGIVVPGYIALQLAQPDRLAGIILVSLSTYLIIKILGHYTFLYGRRQMVLCLLVGCLLANFSRQFLLIDLTSSTIQLQAVGWVVPGLIAHWFGKQGIYRTICVLFITAVIVRLIVIIIFNGELLPT